MRTMTVWQPLNEMLALNAAMNDAMGAPARRRGNGKNTRRAGFPLDVLENEQGYMVQAVLPGIQADALEINFADDVLTIRAEVAAPELSEDTTYHLRERAYGTFERAVRFPQTVNSEAIDARYEQGVLLVSLSKAEEAKPRRIEVQVNA